MVSNNDDDCARYKFWHECVRPLDWEGQKPQNTLLPSGWSVKQSILTNQEGSHRSVKRTDSEVHVGRIRIRRAIHGKGWCGIWKRTHTHADTLQEAKDAPTQSVSPTVQFMHQLHEWLPQLLPAKPLMKFRPSALRFEDSLAHHKLDFVHS